MKIIDESLRDQLIGLGYEDRRVDAALDALRGDALGTDDLLSLRQLAKELGVHETTIWRLRPPYVWIGKRKKYRLPEVMAFMQAYQDGRAE